MNSPDLHNTPKDHRLQPTDVEFSNENELRRADEPETTIDRPSALTNEGSWNDDTILEDRDGSATEKAQLASANAVPRTQSGNKDRTNQMPADIKEVWFAGVHSDVYVRVDLVMSSALRLVVGVGQIARARGSMREMFRLCGCVRRRPRAGWS